VLETLAEGGLVGLLPLIVVMTMVGKRFLREALPKANGPIYLGALAVYAVLSYQFMGGIQHLWVSTFFMTLFICATRPNEQSQAARSSWMPPKIARAPVAPAHR
jgi:O-antigen ligase